jgi:hypothetical protein
MDEPCIHLFWHDRPSPPTHPIALSKPPYRLICLSTSSRALIAHFKLGSRSIAASISLVWSNDVRQHREVFPIHRDKGCLCVFHCGSNQRIR